MKRVELILVPTALFASLSRRGMPRHHQLREVKRAMGTRIGQTLLNLLQETPLLESLIDTGIFPQAFF